MQKSLIVPALKFHTGNTIPQIGFGTWPIKGDDCYKAVKFAVINAGYRQIDTAFFYDNHKDISRALKEIFATTDIKRSDLFITSKISRMSHGYEKALEEADKIFKELELDYLDLLLIHNPFVEGLDKQDPKAAEVRLGTWKALEKLKDEGKVKDIGVSKYTVNHFKHLFAHCKHKPVINQIECHPLLFEDEIIKFCRENDIIIQAFSPIAKARPELLENEVIVKLAKKYNKTPAQICLRWGVQQGFVVIPKSTNENRIKENIDIFDWELEKEDFEVISKLDRKLYTGMNPHEIA